MNKLILLLTIVAVSHSSLFSQDTVSRRNASISPLYYISTDPPSGSASKELLRYELLNGEGLDLEDRLLEISIGGNLPGGVGKSMRASLWNAASVTGQLMGDPLFDKIFSLRMKGRVDGPSAGGLFTIAMLSLITGDQLNSEVTMTGTILPDGSIGAVGGVRYKLEGAKKAGLKKVILPDTLRIETDKTGEIIDLEEHGNKLGLKVVFASNILDAYPHFTGKKLKTWSKFDGANQEIKLPHLLFKKLKERTKERYKLVRGLSQTVLENGIPKRANFEHDIQFLAVSQVVKNELLLMAGYFERADALMQESDWIGAFESVNNAYISIGGILNWQSGGFAFFNDQQIEELTTEGIKSLLKSRDLMVGATSEGDVEKAMLRVRSYHDGLNIFAIHRAHDYSNTTLVALVRSLEEKWDAGLRTAEIREMYDTSVAGSRFLDASRSLMAAKVIGLKGATGLSEARDDSSELDLDLLSGAFTLRGENNEPKPLNKKKVGEWLLFNKTRNDIHLENLKSIIAEEGATLNDIYVRKATVLIESAGVFQNEKRNIFNGITDETSKLFAEAVLYAKQEVELRVAIIKVQILENHKSAFNSMLKSVRINAALAIQQAELKNYKMYGPRYDFLRADSLKEGDADARLMALRLYMSSCSVCRLLQACTD
jgi:hypothetical protein